MFSRNSEQDLLITTVSKCSLFSGLSQGELKALLKVAHIRDYAEEEKIFESGTIGLCLYIIVKGSVKIIAEKEGAVSVIRQFREGEFFSEVHLFSENLHTVSGTASEVTRLIVIARPDIRDLVKIKPKLGNKVLLSFLDFFGSRLDELYRENTELKHKLKP